MCRRCTQCEGMSHHWIDNLDFGDEDELIENNSTTHVCKHCGAMGDSCDLCYGEGLDPDVMDEEVPCPECDGEGVILKAGGVSST